MTTSENIKNAIFTQDQKEELASTLSDSASLSRLQQVNLLEAVICKQLVAATRDASSAFAERVGNRIAKFLFEE